MPVTTVYDELNREAGEIMAALEEERNEFPKHRAKVEAFLAEMPEGRRESLRDFLLPLERERG